VGARAPALHARRDSPALTPARAHPPQTIESAPEVFAELLESMGVMGLDVEEVFDLDALAALEPIGILFLFKHGGRAPPPPPAAAADAADGVWFARQTINNACGTQALLHVVLNAAGGGAFALGDTLRAFKDFTDALPPAERGECLGACDAVRVAHNSFARPEPFVAARRAARESDDVFHFIAYAPAGARGEAFELDGLARAPVCLGGGGGGGWVGAAAAAVRARVAAAAAGEVRFNVCAVVRDARAVAADAAAAAAEALDDVRGALLSLGAEPRGAAPEAALAAAGVGGGGVAARAPRRGAAAGDGADVAALLAREAALLADIADAGRAAAAARRARARGAEENARRRTNLVPLLLALLRGLAPAGALPPLLAAARAAEAAARGRRQAAVDEAKAAAMEE
jgi:ubiquitin carboxyl-terminal hydrolase L5